MSYFVVCINRGTKEVYVNEYSTVDALIDDIDNSDEYYWETQYDDHGAGREYECIVFSGKFIPVDTKTTTTKVVDETTLRRRLNGC